MIYMEEILNYEMYIVYIYVLYVCVFVLLKYIYVY